MVNWDISISSCTNLKFKGQFGDVYLANMAMPSNLNKRMSTCPNDAGELEGVKQVDSYFSFADVYMLHLIFQER